MEDKQKWVTSWYVGFLTNLRDVGQLLGFRVSGCRTMYYLILGVLSGSWTNPIEEYARKIGSFPQILE